MECESDSLEWTFSERTDWHTKYHFPCDFTNRHATNNKIREVMSLPTERLLLLKKTFILAANEENKKFMQKNQC